MSTPNPYESVVRFAAFELDFSGRDLRKSGLRIRCQEQPLQVLAALLEKPGVLITREELRQRLWPEDTYVDFDHALNTAVKKLRGALSDDADAPRYIETVPRRGYRFIGQLQEARPVPVSPSPSLTQAPVSSDSSPPFLQRGFFILAVALILAAGTAYYLNAHRTRAAAVASASQPAMLAVLPFQNMTSDPSQESFADGMTEETTTRLARLNSARFHVIARTSSMKFKNASKSIDEIARELHASHVLESSLRREGAHVRITSRLIRAADQSPQWSQSYDYDSGEPLALEMRVAESIAGQISTVMGDAAARHHAIEEDQFDSYLRGLADSSIHTPEGLDRIIATFEKAVVDDPNCAQPLAGLARVYERGANLGFLQPSFAYAKARTAAERAIQLDPSVPESHVFMADALLTIDYDWKGAHTEIQRALDLNANDPLAHEWYGTYLALSGHSDQALQEMQRAVDLDPVNADHKIYYGWLLLSAKRSAEAEEQLKAALQLDPSAIHAHSALIEVYSGTNRPDDAISEWSSVFFLQNQRDAAEKVKSIYAQSGFEAARRFALNQSLAYLTRIRGQRYVSSYAFACLHARLGDKAQTVDWLEKSYQSRDVELPSLAISLDSMFPQVKDDPRVRSILQKIHPPQ